MRFPGLPAVPTDDPSPFPSRWARSNAASDAASQVAKVCQWERQGQNGSRPPVVIVTGPTASGKTATGIRLARRFDGEILNADSMQVYRYLDIGTAKPTLAERAEVPHHLIDIVTPDVQYNAGRYSRDARARGERGPAARSARLSGRRHGALHPGVSGGTDGGGRCRPRSSPGPRGRAPRRRGGGRAPPAAPSPRLPRSGERCADSSERPGASDPRTGADRGHRPHCLGAAQEPPASATAATGRCTWSSIPAPRS